MPDDRPHDAASPVRPRAIRPIWVAALVAGGILSCWAMFRVEQHLSSPPSTPATGQVTFDVVASDARTGNAIAGAEVGIDEETGDIDPPEPTWKAITDAGGRARLVHDFEANTVLGKDGKVRGRVVFSTGPPLMYLSYLIVVRASGYRDQRIDLEGVFPRGIAYEDPSPRTIRVQLAPGPAEGGSPTTSPRPMSGVSRGPPAGSTGGP